MAAEWLKKIGSFFSSGNIGGDMLSGAASSVGGIIGSAINLKAQRENNKHNEKMINLMNEENAKQNQLGRDFSAAEAQKARDFTVEMFNKENEYNDPAQQVKRYEAAGLNPAMMAGQISAGTASAGGTSQASAPGTIPMQAALNNPEMLDTSAIQRGFENLMTPIRNGLESIANVKNTNSQTTLNEDTHDTNLKLRDYVIPQVQAAIDKMRGDTNWYMTTPEAQSYARIMSLPRIKLDNLMHSQEYNNLFWNGMVTKANYAYTMTDIRTKQILNHFLPAQQVTDLFVKFGTYYNLMAQGDLSYGQFRKTMLEGDLLEIDKNFRNKTFDSLVDAFNAENSFKTADFGAQLSDLPEKYQHLQKQRMHEKNLWRLDEDYAEKFKKLELRTGRANAAFDIITGIASSLIPGAAIFKGAKLLDKSLKGYRAAKSAAKAKRHFDSTNYGQYY